MAQYKFLGMDGKRKHRKHKNFSTFWTTWSHLCYMHLSEQNSH